MFRHDIGENAAAHIEFGSEAHISRLQGGSQVIEYTVGDGFVERAFVAVRPDVELEAFKLDAFF